MFKHVVCAAAALCALIAAETRAETTDGSRLSYFCSSCHGTDGSGLGESIPRIGGQKEEYILISLNEMKSGLRRSTLMKTVASGYDNEELKAISRWYASKTWNSPLNSVKTVPDSKMKNIVSSCSGCHGIRGEGSGPTPAISGQSALYLYSAMNEYKTGTRNAAGSGAPMAFLSSYDDETIRSAAEYYSNSNGGGR